MKNDRQIYQGILQPKGFPGLPADWASEWETFPSADHTLQLFGVRHFKKPDGGPRSLLISHGIGEHGGRYLHFPHYLEGAVDEVYCLDHRGHGRSEGARGHVERFTQFADDLALAIRREDARLKKKHGRSELHVLGHSMGSLILLKALFMYPDLPVRSVILSSPLLGVVVKVPAVKKMAAGTLSKLWGSLQLANEIDVSHLSRDQAVVEAYQADRLVHTKITPRLYTEMMATIEEASRRDHGIAAPLLMLVPMGDQIVDSKLALKFFQSLKHQDKELKTYPGFSHESFNETEKEKAFEDLKAWIKQVSSRTN